uniref:Uncharacterized protein n=1 Tax=Setaria italica TaxID=4555 RepID=K3Y417_SETIT
MLVQYLISFLGYWLVILADDVRCFAGIVQEY